MLYVSYWNFFRQYYTPLLQEMDIILKGIDNEEPISVAETARALVMKEKTVEKIMVRESIQCIDQEGFLRIVMNGTSPLCRLLQREYLCGSPERYNSAHIAYIYGLQSEHVAEVFRANGYTEIRPQALQDVLDKIFIFIMQ